MRECACVAYVWTRPGLNCLAIDPARGENGLCVCVCAREKGAVGAGVKETLVRRKGECARVCGAGVGGRGE